MARVLVTGASGFIGTALTPRLIAAGHVPRLMFRKPPSAPPPSPAEVVIGDLADVGSLRAAVQGADAVVHLGAATSSGRLDPAVAYRINVGGATALVDACRAAGTRRVIVASTQHVHLPRPGLYGRTKRIADAIFRDAGLEVTILRPSLVYGPGSSGVFVKLVGLVRKLPVIPVIGKGLWHLRPVYLENFVDVVVEAVGRRELAGRMYDVGGPDLVTYDEFLAAICTAMGKRCRSFHMPLKVSFVLATILERLLANPPLTVDNVHGSTVEAPCDLTALRRDFHVSLTPLAAGLGLTLGSSQA